MVRRLIVVGLVVGACKGGDKQPATGSGSQAATPGSAAIAVAKNPLAARVPKVATDEGLALPSTDGKVPLLVFVAADGASSVAVGPAKWSELGSFVPATTKPADLRGLSMLLREGVMLGKTPAEIYESWSLQPAALAQDDPPPPEEEEEDPPPPEDPDDTAGSTGTAMALEEGKMGKKDSDRAEGQYKMKKNQDDPQLARQQAIERARTVGILGSIKSQQAGSFASARARDTEQPAQLAAVIGVVDDQALLDPQTPAMIAAHPQAKATALIDVVAATKGVILVAHGREVRPLRLQFPRIRDVSSLPDGEQRWLEVRLTPTETVIEAVPNTPVKIAAPGDLATEYKKLLATTGYENATVDVLVSPDVDVQRLVDMLVTLDGAGARVIGLGAAPAADDPQFKLRGRPINAVALGPPTAMGNLDKSVIRRVIKMAQPKIVACYETALLKQPKLEGTVMVSFFIKADGKVAGTTARGVAPAVSDCVAKVITAIEFPKPDGGGGVQVNYPFTFRRL